MVPIRDQIAGILADIVAQRIKNPDLVVFPQYYAERAQDIIDRVIDDGQYVNDEESYEGCCLDCTAAHNALWSKIDHLEEECCDCDCGKTQEVMLDNIAFLEDRVSVLEARLEAAAKTHHQREKPTWETWTYSNGGKWIISPEHLEG